MKRETYRSLCGGLAALGVALLSGCSARLNLYPVSGPVAAMTPPPVYPARISVNFATRSGGLSTTLAGGETFQGRWKMETPGPANPASATDLSGSWDAVYGPGYFTAHVLGNRNCGSAQITGSHGTLLAVQICGTPETKAVAKDAAGNVYKLTVG